MKIQKVKKVQKAQKVKKAKPEAPKLSKKERKKQLLQFLVIAVLIGVAFWYVIPKSGELRDSDRFQRAEVEAKAMEVVALLDAGDYEGLKDMSMEKFKPMINEEEMTAVRKKLADNWGALKEKEVIAMTEIVERGNHSAVVQLHLTYENTEVYYLISLNEVLKLNGLQMK